MFDIRKRAAFRTVGELRALLNRLPAETTVSICGDIDCFYHEERGADAICLDCEDLREHYEEVLERMLSDETPAGRDQHLESLWGELADVPMDPDTECIIEPYLHFSRGTSRESIWRWFDEHHSKGVAYLLYEASRPAVLQESALTQFIHEEVLCRLSEVFALSDEQITGELVYACVHALAHDSDMLFNYEKIDEQLRKIMAEHGVDGRDSE